jgi:hypothetical protein
MVTVLGSNMSTACRRAAATLRYGGGGGSAAAMWPPALSKPLMMLSGVLTIAATFAALLAALGCSPRARVQLVGFAGEAQASLMSHAEHVSMMIFCDVFATAAAAGTLVHYTSSSVCAGDRVCWADGGWTVMTVERIASIVGCR